MNNARLSFSSEWTDEWSSKLNYGGRNTIDAIEIYLQL